jgi:hypothetical protein
MLYPIINEGACMNNNKGESILNSNTPKMEVIDNKNVSELKSVDGRFSNKGKNLNDVPPSPYHVEDYHLKLGKQS